MHVNHSRMKLGKQTPRHGSRTLQFAKYFAAEALPLPPATDNWAARVPAWPMMANDKIGYCTYAAAGHMIQQWTTYVGTAMVPKDRAIIAAYSTITGYDPKSGANDHGVAEVDVPNYWPKGRFDRHKITAYVALEPSNICKEGYRSDSSGTPVWA